MAVAEYILSSVIFQKVNMLVLWCTEISKTLYSCQTIKQTRKCALVKVQGLRFFNYNLIIYTMEKWQEKRLSGWKLTW